MTYGCTRRLMRDCHASARGGLRRLLSEKRSDAIPADTDGTQPPLPCRGHARLSFIIAGESLFTCPAAALASSVWFFPCRRHLHAPSPFRSRRALSIVRCGSLRSCSPLGATLLFISPLCTVANLQFVVDLPVDRRPRRPTSHTRAIVFTIRSHSQMQSVRRTPAVACALMPNHPEPSSEELGGLPAPDGVLLSRVRRDTPRENRFP